MYSVLQVIHSYWAYLVLITLVLALGNALMGLSGNKNFTDTDRRLTLFALIGAHVQFLLGIILYFVSPLGIQNFGAGTMKDATARLYALEHPLIMLIAVVLITIGYSKSKRQSNNQSKFRTISLTFSIALLLILSRIPWAAWFN
jgi:heme A synthase